MRLSGLALIATVLSGDVFAQNNGSISAAHLKAACSDASQLSQIGCNSFLQGFLGGMHLGMTLVKDIPSIRYCLPADGITNRQAATTFLDYIEKRHDRLNDAAYLVLYSAMINQFPCR